jgi:class 3 adenylate cyclase
MFTDFVGFSRIAGTLDPEELVRLLDKTFRAFDGIISRHGLEKIKTIGDAYMCVGGLPKPSRDHARRTVAAALEIQEYLEGAGDFRARIGIHSGPVVAGVVGRDKFAYDIWGDTVNQASRLEKAGRAGAVTVSAVTCELLGSGFDCIHNGTFEAKNIGEMDSYVVRARRLTKKPS